jgi:hypothetical protein
MRKSKIIMRLEDGSFLTYSRFHLPVQSKAGPLMECCDLAPLWYSGAAITSLPGVLWEPSAATWRRFGSLAPPRLVAQDYQSGDKSPHSIPVHATEKRCNAIELKLELSTKTFS